MEKDEYKDIAKEFNIQHVVVDDLPKYEGTWERENYQRNCIIKGLEKDKARGGDLILISDADEIPNPDHIYAVKQEHHPVVLLRMPFFYYNFRWMKKFPCHGTSCVRSKDLCGKTPQDYRDPRFTDPYINLGGWHCSFFGTPEEISLKIRSLAHDEWDHEEYYNVDSIRERVEKGKDIYNRGAEEDLVSRPKHIEIPRYVSDNSEKFNHLI